ncbi:putative xenobiotic compound monooxygenase, DszA family [Karstenula rhodostoma CBS 690.94]|uniref:Xenobiotic compound monooxygenase, DszA family n=1 Tax=Karstenula rhodostoma CBS 690.94 TaxID=1392251 RepID=A0A9P4P7D3_9PLEO|nr:putative xenobiotic compound monooxygenase, DszA family [Karstenula rhodostoma CBS 690.94]
MDSNNRAELRSSAKNSEWNPCCIPRTSLQRTFFKKPREDHHGEADPSRKKLILNAFVEMCSGHQSPSLATWYYDTSTEFNSISHWVHLAKLLEAAKFHGIFIADVLGGYNVYRGPRNPAPALKSGAQWPANEPLAVTKHRGPPHRGRLGWDIVAGYLDSAARNLVDSEQPEHDGRYAMAEYIKVMYKLFESSWRDDAVLLDRQRAIYPHPALVREINHEGKYYTVPYPHICQPSPQRTPLLLQAGTSKAGKTFAAQNAESIFVGGHSPSVVAEEAKAKSDDYAQDGDLDGALALFGVWTGIDLAVYHDDEELRHVRPNAIRSTVEAWSKASLGIPKWSKKTVAKNITIGGLGATVVGTAAQVADEFERWVKEADVDGFNILLIPELRRRGLFWDEHLVQGGTYRENFYGRPGESGPLGGHVASGYRWRKGVSVEEAGIPA